MSRWLIALSVVSAGSLGPSGALAFERPGDGALSASIGGIGYLADEDSRSDMQPRFSFGGYVEYSPSTRWALRLASGVGWVGYPREKTEASESVRGAEPVKVVSPTTATLIRRLSPGSENFLYAGLGVGVYFWHFKVSGKRQLDPVTFQPVKSSKLGSFDPGLNALLGLEYPLSPSVALLGEAQGHLVMSANEHDRPDKSGTEFEGFPAFNGNDAFVELRFGAKVYFDLIRFEGPEEEF